MFKVFKSTSLTPRSMRVLFSQAKSIHYLIKEHIQDEPPHSVALISEDEAKKHKYIQKIINDNQKVYHQLDIDVPLLFHTELDEKKDQIINLEFRKDNYLESSKLKDLNYGILNLSLGTFFLGAGSPGPGILCLISAYAIFDDIERKSKAYQLYINPNNLERQYLIAEEIARKGSCFYRDTGIMMVILKKNQIQKVSKILERAWSYKSAPKPKSLMPPTEAGGIEELPDTPTP